MSETITVLDGGRPLSFTHADLSRYHGFNAPGGVVQAMKIMARGFALLGPVERRALRVETCFTGDGVRDSFELVARAVTGGRYVIEPALALADAPPTQAPFVFLLHHGDRSVRLTIRPGMVRDAFIAMACKPDRSPADEAAFMAMKQEMADRLLPLAPEAVYDAALVTR
jgi:hypothetical protein